MASPAVVFEYDGIAVRVEADSLDLLAASWLAQHAPISWGKTRHTDNPLTRLECGQWLADELASFARFVAADAVTGDGLAELVVTNGNEA